jgi:hypothetical protein
MDEAAAKANPGIIETCDLPITREFSLFRLLI